MVLASISPIFIALIIVSNVTIKFAKNNLEIMPIEIRSVAPADKEVAAFLIAYILPFLNIIKSNCGLYSPKKFDFKYSPTTDGLRQAYREEGKVHCKAQAKRKEQQRDSV